MHSLFGHIMRSLSFETFKNDLIFRYLICCKLSSPLKKSESVSKASGQDCAGHVTS